MTIIDQFLDSTTVKKVFYASTAAATVILALPYVVPGALSLIGFSAIGPVAGTYPLDYGTFPVLSCSSLLFSMPGTPAAAMMSAAGNVAANGAIATAESIAIGGAIPTVVNAGAALVAGTAGWVAGPQVERRLIQ